jgi:hypothetical protein
MKSKFLNHLPNEYDFETMDMFLWNVLVLIFEMEGLIKYRPTLIDA